MIRCGGVVVRCLLALERVGSIGGLVVSSKRKSSLYVGTVLGVCLALTSQVAWIHRWSGVCLALIEGP